MQDYRLRVFENRVLKRKYGPKKDEVARVSRKLCNEVAALKIIRIMKSRRMRWAEHIARMGRRRSIILRWILVKWIVVLF
jgi:hypothetical protein